MSTKTLALALVLLTAGCSATAADNAADERAAIDRCDEDGVQCQAYGRKSPQGKPPAFELGTGNGSAASVTFTTIYQGPAGHDPIDLEWNPKRSAELWVVNYASSSVTIITNPGKTNQRAKVVRDPAYSHFMNLPPGIAFGLESSSGYGQQWATCGDNTNGGNNFMGPTLYSSDDRLFGKQTEDGLGSHLDMLHSTPLCRGIAWAGSKNAFFAFNAKNHSIEYYDFKTNHEPGGDDHSDGIIRRYWTDEVKGVDGLVSHLSWDAASKKLYVADTGNGRILSLDPALGSAVGPLTRANEYIAEHDYFAAPVTELVAPGTLVAPSGIEASGGLAFVTDSATSTIYAFNLSNGALVRKLATGLPAQSLAGLNFGPDGKIYFVDRTSNRIVRIDP